MSELSEKYKTEYQEAPETIERETPSALIKDIVTLPIPKNVGEEVIWGTPIDWHDLENFVVSISPIKFVNLLKLQKEQLRAYGMRFKDDKPKGSSKGIWLILLIVGLMIGGIIVMMYMPEIQAMLNSNGGIQGMIP